VSLCISVRFLAMDEAVLRSTGEGLETGSGRKNTSLDSSLATLHQAENKVILVVSITVAGLRIRITLMRIQIQLSTSIRYPGVGQKIMYKSIYFTTISYQY
jgi:hypothetical protein